MSTSCGIIPFREKNGKLEFFVSHPSGAKNYWAFCKGHAEDDETWVETALREFKEETGLPMTDCDTETFIPLGSVQQNPRKNVVAFGVHYPDIDPKLCFSNMCEDGVTPENDDYRWMTFDELKNVTHKTHLTFYEELIRMYNDTLC